MTGHAGTWPCRVARLHSSGGDNPDLSEFVDFVSRKRLSLINSIYTGQRTYGATLG